MQYFLLKVSTLSRCRLLKWRLVEEGISYLHIWKEDEIFPKQISKKCQFCAIIIKSIVEEFM